MTYAFKTLYRCALAFFALAVFPLAASASDRGRAGGDDGAGVLLNELSARQARQVNRNVVRVRHKPVRHVNVVRVKPAVVKKAGPVIVRQPGPVVVRTTPAVVVRPVPVGVISTGAVPVAIATVPVVTAVSAPFHGTVLDKPVGFYNKSMAAPQADQGMQPPPSQQNAQQPQDPNAQSNQQQQNPQQPQNPQQTKPNDPMIYVGTPVIPFSAIAPPPENSHHPGWFWFPNPEDKKWYPVRTAKAAAAAGDRCRQYSNAVSEWSNRATANGKAYGFDSQEYKDTLAMQKQAVQSFLECIQTFPPGEGE